MNPQAETPPLATRDELFSLTSRRYLQFPLPFSGKNVRIRSLLETEKEGYEAAMLSTKGGLSLAALKEARRRLIVLTLVDATGNQILTDADTPKLKTLDGGDLAAIYDAAMQHCGFKQDEIEALIKNSGNVRADA